jgi:hypothetical protein
VVVPWWLRWSMSWGAALGPKLGEPKKKCTP